MGAIKDVVDLATQLSESVQDRKFAADLMQIIRLINTIQSEQAALTENNIQLMSDKAALERRIHGLESDISRLEKEISDLNKVSSDEVVRITEKAFDILQMLFEAHNGLSKEEIANGVHLSLGEAAYHFDILKRHKFVFQSSNEVHAPPSWIGELGSYRHIVPRAARYSLTSSGRAYFVENRET